MNIAEKQIEIRNLEINLDAQTNLLLNIILQNISDEGLDELSGYCWDELNFEDRNIETIDRDGRILAQAYYEDDIEEENEEEDEMYYDIYEFPQSMKKELIDFIISEKLIDVTLISDEF